MKIIILILLISKVLVTKLNNINCKNCLYYFQDLNKVGRCMLFYTNNNNQTNYITTTYARKYFSCGKYGKRFIYKVEY
jgi:hypothetical protein